MTIKLIKIDFTSAREDSEKAVTPTIIWVKETEGKYSAYCIAVGWWHYAVRLFIGIVFK